MHGACHQLARCCHFAGHCLKENELRPLVGRSLFLYACVIPFSCQRPLGVSGYFYNFLFLIQLKFFKNYLFIPYNSSLEISRDLRYIYVILFLVAHLQTQLQFPYFGVTFCKIFFLLPCITPFIFSSQLFYWKLFDF